MILQTLLSVAFIAVIAAAIMTSALANAKVAAHQAASRIATAALARGTDEFVNWAQIYVAKHGAATTWPTTRIVDQPVAACGTSSMLRNSWCSNVVTISYLVTGTTFGSNSGLDPISNLQKTLNEERITGNVSIEESNVSGIVFSKLSRNVMLRVFDAFPFANVTAVRDGDAMAGSTQAVVGDSSGYLDSSFYDNRATPNPSIPNSDKDTTITVTMDCDNSSENSNQQRPFADDKAPGNDFKPWGTSGGHGFEAPCIPSYFFNSVPAVPADAAPTDGNVYAIGSFHSSTWTNLSAAESWP